MDDPRLLWWLSRGSGLVCLALLTLAVVLGARATRRAAGHELRYALSVLHRTCAPLGLALLVVHVATVVGDGHVDITWLDTVVPGTAGYEPAATALGALAADLVLALALTSLVRARLGARAWHLLHRAGYAVWPLALAHTLALGTDADRPAVRVGLTVATLAVGTGLARRLTVGPDPAPGAGPQRGSTAGRAPDGTPVLAAATRAARR